MTTIRNTKPESAIRDSINQTISYQDLNVPKLCKVPAIEEFLRTHSNISPLILKAYNRKGRMRSKNTNNSNIIREEQNIYYSPFEISVYGAYPFMSDWEILIETMKIAYDKKAQLKYIGEDIKNGYKYKTINFDQYKKDKVLKRLKSFAKGFKYGFDSFIATHINSPSSISTSENFKVQRMFDFLSTTFEVNGGFQTIRFNTTEQQGNTCWYEDGIQTGYEYHAWYYIFINHKSFEPYFKTQISEKNRFNSIKGKGNKNKKPSTSSIKDPLNFIDPDLINVFMESEKLALGATGKFNSKIRCAAFCELLYDKKYILQTKTRIKTMVSFAKQKYNIDIEGSLAASKKTDRNNHKIRSVNKMPGLKNCFS